MFNDLNFMLRQNKIDMLLDQNTQLRKQIQLLKNTNSALVESIHQIERDRDQFFHLKMQNLQLTDILESERRRNEEIEQKYYEEIKRLKQQLTERNNEIELLHIQQQKEIFRIQQELRYYKGLLKNKINKLDQCQDQLHSLTLQRFGNTDQTQMSGISKSLSRSMVKSHFLIDSRIYKNQQITNENNMEKSNISRRQYDRNATTNKSHLNITKSILNCEGKALSINQKALQLSRFSKQEIKIAIKTLGRADKSLRQGSMEVSVLQDRKSKAYKQGKNR